MKSNYVFTKIGSGRFEGLSRNLHFVNDYKFTTKSTTESLSKKRIKKLLGKPKDDFNITGSITVSHIWEIE
jgi:hypothetical protein